MRKDVRAQGKARDVKWCAARQEVASLDVAGCLKLWTGDLTHKADVRDPPCSASCPH